MMDTDLVMRPDVCNVCIDVSVQLDISYDVY
jgi:hypothetical protein